MQSKDPWHASPLKSTSPLPSVSNISMTLCTRGFCCSSGKDMNSSTLRDPELSRSSFLNLFPSLLISSASTGVDRENNTEMDSISKHSPVWPSSRSKQHYKDHQTLADEWSETHSHPVTGSLAAAGLTRVTTHRGLPIALCRRAMRMPPRCLIPLLSLEYQAPSLTVSSFRWGHMTLRSASTTQHANPNTLLIICRSKVWNNCNSK